MLTTNMLQNEKPTDLCHLPSLKTRVSRKQRVGQCIVFNVIPGYLSCPPAVSAKGEGDYHGRGGWAGDDGIIKTLGDPQGSSSRKKGKHLFVFDKNGE